MFRIHKLRVFVNEMWFNSVWIDPHYELKHSESISDLLILNLVRLLEGNEYSPQERTTGDVLFFETDLELVNRPYRLIWLIPPDQSYLGVRNAYRRKRK